MSVGASSVVTASSLALSVGRTASPRSGQQIGAFLCDRTRMIADPKARGIALGKAFARVAREAVVDFCNAKTELTPSIEDIRNVRFAGVLERATDDLRGDLTRDARFSVLYFALKEAGVARTKWLPILFDVGYREEGLNDKLIRVEDQDLGVLGGEMTRMRLHPDQYYE